MKEMTPKPVLVLFHAYSLAATDHSHRQHKRTSFINVLFFSFLTFCFTTVQQRWIKPMHIRPCSGNVLLDRTSPLHLFKTPSGRKMKERTF